jgi:hypothetical protein
MLSVLSLVKACVVSKICFKSSIEESLCIDCTENHRAMKVSRNHQLVDIAEMPAQVNITSQSCLKHDELPFDYFCIAYLIDKYIVYKFRFVSNNSPSTTCHSD